LFRTFLLFEKIKLSTVIEHLTLIKIGFLSVNFSLFQKAFSTWFSSRFFCMHITIFKQFQIVQKTFLMRHKLFIIIPS